MNCWYPPQDFKQPPGFPQPQGGLAANGFPPSAEVARPASQGMLRPTTSHTQTCNPMVDFSNPFVETSQGMPRPTTAHAQASDPMLNLANPFIERTTSCLQYEAELDRAFLCECHTQLDQLKCQSGNRSRVANKVLSLLSNVRPASLIEIYGYMLAENTCVIPCPYVPILQHGTYTSWLAGPSRPIEQLLHRFPMRLETTPCAQGTGWKSQDKVQHVTIERIRGRFLDAKQRIPKIDAWNLVHLSDPTQQDFLPDYLKLPQFGLLADIKRVCLDNALHNFRDDPDALRENVAHWRKYDNLVMLAEAGALTLPHYDDFGYGTWITCMEGQIGFAWLRDNPALHMMRKWVSLKDGDSSAELGYSFKVLRPDDSIYLPPGTVHYVFRKPDGGQTLAACGSVLHYADLQRWLFVLMTQIGDEESKEQVKTMAPYLMAALRKLLDQTKTMDDLIKYGVMSVDDRNRVLEMICHIEAEAKRH